MNPILALLITLISLSAILPGCKSTAVKNIEESKFVAPQGVSLSQIEQAIIRACRKSGWRVKSSDRNSVLASYSYKRNKFGAVVSIDYDLDSYSINYVSSHNLKYTERQIAEDNIESDSFWSESQQTFAEINPFKKEDDSAAGGSQQNRTIHKIYNQWVTVLDQNINQALNNLGGQQFASSSARKSHSLRTMAVKPENITCNDQPTSNASGLASITRSAVNLRSGAGTHCAISGSVSQNETFTLLGQKNNWYYVSLAQKPNAWIYAPLVKKVNSTTVQEAYKPAPKMADNRPLPPTKKISIAVIHFKTLNKEAQKIALGDLVSETFTSALVNSQGFKIIEREQLDKVVKEMEMNQTGFIETTDAVEIGKMLHADAIITGSVALLSNQIQLNARIIEIESAYVISAETKTTTYSLNNITQMVNEIVYKLSSKLRRSTDK